MVPSSDTTTTRSMLGCVTYAYLSPTFTAAPHVHGLSTSHRRSGDVGSIDVTAKFENDAVTWCSR